MIVRILQPLSSEGEKSHTFAAESYDESTKKWTQKRDCIYQFKNAKVRINNKLAYLVGFTVDNEEELTTLQESYFVGQSIDWNDDTQIYPYLEWVTFFEAYR